MSEIQVSPALGREDIGDVTALRVKVSSLMSDEPTEALFRDAASVVDAGRTRIILNLAEVRFLTSAAIGQLVTFMRKVRAAEGRLVLCKVTRNIEELLHVTHLAEILFVYADEQEAVQSFGS